MCNGRCSSGNDIVASIVEVEDTNTRYLKDVTVLCNSSDYLTLLSKIGDDAYTCNAHGSLYKQDIAATVPPLTETTAHGVVPPQRLAGQWGEGAYDSLPSACRESLIEEVATTTSTSLVDFNPITDVATTTASTMNVLQQDEKDSEQYSVYIQHLLNGVGKDTSNFRSFETLGVFAKRLKRVFDVRKDSQFINGQ